ncbi:hypothetical protein [Trueperella pyogenes]|uniref:hypothetical protein n=2 Tax=Trueperella pyogenes TaxID=1661 RepID=UPI00101382BA|nr:hypothetical protein [Trueperella pyogenes]
MSPFFVCRFPYEKTARGWIAVGFALLALTGCSEVSKKTVTPSVDISATTFDYAAWTPETTVHLPQVSQDEFERARREVLESYRNTLKVDSDLPIPALVRPLELRENMQPIVDCMTQAGYPVELSADGRGVVWEKLSDAVATQFWICTAQYTPKSVVHKRETREQLAVKYEYYTTFFVPCAQKQGVVFDQEPPTKETWIASFDNLSQDTLPWLPDSPGQAWSPDSRNRFAEGSQNLRNLYQACPAMPPALHYYGQ